MAKKKWFTEAQLCDFIEESIRANGALEMRDGSLEVEHQSRLREYEIGHNLRPDFLLYSHERKRHVYDVVEVKINADMESVAQLANYVWVFEHHLRNDRHNRFFKNKTTYEINGHLIARTFDRHVHSIAAQLGYKLWRLHIEKVGGKEIALFEEEDHPHENSPLDDAFCKVLEGGDPALQMESEMQRPTADQVVH